MGWRGICATFEDVKSLAVQVIVIASRVVDVPESTEVMNLRSPYIAASRCSVGGVDNLLGSCLETVYRG